MTERRSQYGFTVLAKKMGAKGNVRNPEYSNPFFKEKNVLKLWLSEILNKLAARSIC